MPRATLLFIGATDDHLLDLVELMNAIKARGVFARSARLAAKTRGNRAVLERQRFRGNDLVGMNAHESDLARASEKEIMSRAARGLFDVIRLLATCRKEASSDHALFFDDHGNAHRREAALVGHEVNCVAQHRLMKSHAEAAHHIVARARHLDSAFEVDEAVHLHQLEMRARREATVLCEGLGEVESRRRPSTHFNVVVTAFALRDILCRRLRHLHPQRFPLRLDLRHLHFALMHLRLERGGLGFKFREFALELRLLRITRILEFPLELAHARTALFADAVLFSACILLAHEHCASRFIEREESIDIDIHALVAHAIAEAVGVLAKFLEINHV